jgi:Na+/glutamate symporter
MPVNNVMFFSLTKEEEEMDHEMEDMEEQEEGQEEAEAEEEQELGKRAITYQVCVLLIVYSISSILRSQLQTLTVDQTCLDSTRSHLPLFDICLDSTSALIRHLP